MRARIHPVDIDVPSGNPFENDRFNRQGHVEILTRVIKRLEGPCTLSVDAPWGEGKTTFLRLWRKYLENCHIPVVSFNAWESDYVDDPFIALSEEITKGLEEYASDELNAKLRVLGDVTLDIVKHSLPAIIRIGTAGVLDVSSLMEQEIGGILGSYAKERISAHRQITSSVSDFRAKLQDISDSLSQEYGDAPLVIIVDELDRCRPSYAIELLEVAKHLFAVDGVVFIMAVNRTQLAHSIRAVYGDQFDADDYLNRFFSISYRLPPSNNRVFIASLFNSLGLAEYHQPPGPVPHAGIQIGRADSVFQFFFRGPGVSKRTVAQAIQHFNLVFLSLSDNNNLDGRATAFAIVIRSFASDVYEAFLKGHASDAEVADVVFASSGTESRRHDTLAREFEKTLIAACMHIQGRPDTELRQRYVQQRSSSLDYDVQHADDILTSANSFGPEGSETALAFQEAASIIDLTSNFLLEN